MGRRNRPGRDEPEPLDLERAMMGQRRVEHRRDGSWNVQPMSAAGAVKDYSCPGCALPIPAGTAHLVAWRADGILGDDNDLAARRHWHTQCWRIAG